MVTECVYCEVETDVGKYVQINFILPVRLYSFEVRHPRCVCTFQFDPLYSIFPHYLINGTIKKKIGHTMCVSSFSTTFVRNISHYKKN